MSTTEWDDAGKDVEEVGPNEPEAVPPGSADEESEGNGGDDDGRGDAAGSSWTEGGGELGPEGAKGVDPGAEPPRREEGSF